MKFVYTPGFRSDLNTPNLNITIFTCSLIKKDNPHDTNINRLNKVEVPINTAIGKLNEDIYVIELDYQSIADAKYLVDGVQFSRYNELRLYYTDSNGDRKLAGWININQSNSNILVDYAKNYIYVDLSPYPINCHIHLQETISLNVVDKSETPEPIEGITYFYYLRGKLEKFDGDQFSDSITYYEFSTIKNNSMSVPGLVLNHKHYLGGTESLMSSEKFFDGLKQRLSNPGGTIP